MNYLSTLIILMLLFGCVGSGEEHSFENHKNDTVPLPDIQHKIVESVDSISGNRHVKEYYSNGILKHEWEEIQMNGGMSVSVEQFYDTTGLLILKNEYNYSNGTTYDETHVVMKSIEYYSTGKEKLKKHEEFFMMGEKCPCGIWEYFNELGELIKQEKKGNCEDFDLDCL